MENQTRQVEGSKQRALLAVAEGKPNQEDLLTSMVSLRTSEVLEHLGIHYAHENPLALQKLQEEQEKEEAQKKKQSLLYQSLTSEQLGGDQPTGRDALFAAAGNLAKVDAKAKQKNTLDDQVDQKITSLNIQNLVTQEDLINDFLKLLNDLGDGSKTIEQDSSDFKKVIEDLKQYFKGDKNVEALLNKIESGVNTLGKVCENDWWFGGFGIFQVILKECILPKVETLFEQAIEMPSPFQQALDKVMQKLQKADQKELAFIQALQIKVAEGSHATGQNAVFESSALVAEVTNDAQENELNDLEKRVQELEKELQGLVKMEKLLVMYTNAVQQFQKTHDFNDFFKVLLILFSEFGKNPNVKGELNKILKEGIRVYFDSARFGSFFGEFIWDIFTSEVVPILNNIQKNNMNDPALAGLFLSQGKKAFDKIVKETMKAIQQMEQIIRFIDEDQGENAIFLMMAEIMQMEAVALKSNANQNKIQEQESQKNIQNLQQTMTKINAALKKLEEAEHAHHHHGIFGWVEDFFDAIGDLLKKIGEMIKDVCTGNFHAAGNDFKSIGMIKALTSLFDHLKKAFTDMIHGKIGAAFSQLKQVAEIVVEAAILTALFGPAGLMLMGTKFGNDMKDAGTLVMDAVQAFGQLVLAGLAAGLGGPAGIDFAKKLMKSDKKLGIDMLENPALKPLLDCIAIALAVVCAAAGQVEVAVLIIGLMILSDTGVMGDIESGLTKMFEAMGCSSTVAKVLADVTVIVIITALTLGAGSLEATGEEVGDTLEEQGIEDGSELAQEVKENETELKVINAVGDSVQSISENTASQSSSAAEAAEDAKNSDGIATRIAKAIGRRVGTRAGAGLMGFGMSLGMTNFGVDLARAIDKNDKELQMILMIVQEVVAAISAAVGGAGVAFGSAATEAAEASEGVIKQAVDKLSATLTKAFGTDAASMAQLANQMQRLYTVAQGIYAGMEGGLEMLEGDYMAELGKERGLYQLIDSLQQINIDAMKQTSDRRGKLVKEFDQINDELIKAPGLIAEAQYQVMSQNIV